MSGNNGGQSQVDRAAEAFANRMLTYPIEEQIGVGLIAKNVINGCSWEFTRNNIDIKKHIADFDKSEVCSVFPVKNGHLVSMPLTYIVGVLNKEAKGLFDQRDLQMAQRHRQEALILLDKKMKEGYTGKIGIYCTNDSTSITIDGTRYPAYAVTLPELLTVCIRNNYGLMLGGYRKPTEVSAKAAMVIKNLDIAPSGNALMIDIVKR